MSKPETIPFWEQSRGGGPITDWNNSRAEMHRRAAEREARYANPVAVLGEGRVKDTDSVTAEQGHGIVTVAQPDISGEAAVECSSGR